jgi:hypothetical protein
MDPALVKYASKSFRRDMGGGERRSGMQQEERGGDWGDEEETEEVERECGHARLERRQAEKRTEKKKNKKEKSTGIHAQRTVGDLREETLTVLLSPDMYTKRHEFFRWTPRTAWISFVYIVAIPSATLYLFQSHEVRCIFCLRG